MQSVKNFLSKITPTHILVGVIVILVFLVCILFKKNSEKGDTLTEYQTVLKLKDQEVKHWKDSSGRDHARILQIEASSQVIQSVFGKKIDSLAKALGVTNKAIKEYAQVSFTARGSGTGTVEKPKSDSDAIVDRKVVTPKGDTVKIKDTVSLTMKIDSTKDKHLNFNATVFKNNTFDFDYTYKDKLSYTKFDTKKKGLLGWMGLAKETTLDFSLDNKKASIDGVTQFKLSDIDKRRWGVGPYVGYGYNGVKLSPSVGISIQYNAIRF